MTLHRFPYNWKISEQKFTEDKGEVFTCFAGGGGSSFGYKMAGFKVIGCNEIDAKMMDAYKANHNPEFSFLEAIQTFKLREDLPERFYNLDILDGSFPCSSFSTGGNREKDWGKEKKFKEGQKEQVLDTLAFDFIDLTKKLKPKVAVCENVKGLMLGKAKAYVRKIYDEFDKAGYVVQHWLLDGSKMGLPQNRERVFFVALRKDLIDQFMEYVDFFTTYPKLDLNFDEPPINFGEIEEIDENRKPIEESYLKYYEKANKFGVYDERARGGIKFGFYRKAMRNRPLATIMGGNVISIQDQPKYLNKNELCKGGSFPLDYDFGNVDPQYIIGMSVPPVMMAHVASAIYEQWLSKL